MHFPIKLIARSEPSRCLRWVSPVAALVLTVVAGALLFAVLGKNPLTSLYVFLVAPLETLRGWCEVGVKMTPLLLCAVGLTMCYRANVWNIGAEGQLLAGAVLGGTAVPRRRRVLVHPRGTHRGCLGRRSLGRSHCVT